MSSDPGYLPRLPKHSKANSSDRAQATVLAAEHMVNSYQTLQNPQYENEVLWDYMGTESAIKATKDALDKHGSKLSKADWTSKPSQHSSNVRWSTQRGPLSGALIQLKSELKTRTVETLVHFDGNSGRAITRGEFQAMVS